MAYASSSLALAALELFVNLTTDEFPADLVAVELLIPDDITMDAVSADELPTNWRDYPAPLALQELGTEWLRSARSLLLVVPSVLVPREMNLLINPGHPEFERCTVGTVDPFEYDFRMWKAARPSQASQGI
ncbi:MAG: RES domain-containing protein [Planctomycetaceae bacterium]